ncbi:hypothetical protein CC1G_13424 [Coprinopsis cinerea okayama7|uniref:Uncharacterized protein n=1 Tax=Coprinopsis cinerea (strain Okayama-7 / 130 / ATCC MYA-4618 / FGSC 9003) TaxID=240176 RepID=A8N828_COPC7|nr:hypothetical protein CC1G_13424 [Coprinopsis cinerea okayama7\|eukprot:XP_001830984.1 hypothetical protein CC1G_13424 [Coprinopsis cinerea okayama7\
MVGRKRPFSEISTSPGSFPLPKRGPAVEASQKPASTSHADRGSDDIIESTDSETEESDQESTDESEDEVESVPRKVPTFLCKTCKKGFSPMLYLHEMGGECPGKPTTPPNEKSTNEKPQPPKEKPQQKQKHQPKQKAAPKEKTVYWCAMPDCAYTTTSVAWFKKHCLKRHNNDQTQPGWDKPEISDTESTVPNPKATTEATPDTTTIAPTSERANSPPITEFTPEPVSGPSTPPLPPTRILSPTLSLSSLSSLSDISEEGDSESE